MQQNLILTHINDYIKVARGNDLLIETDIVTVCFNNVEPFFFA
jgi:hypothetical protein